MSCQALLEPGTIRYARADSQPAAVVHAPGAFGRAEGATLDQRAISTGSFRASAFASSTSTRRCAGIKLFVNRDQADGNLATPLKPGDEVMIVAALSGG
jgi:molybdopterin converting factor small subunit